MHEALFTLAALARQYGGQATCGEAVEVVADLDQVVEFVHAAAAGEQFAEGLRAAQQQQAEQDELRLDQLQGLVGALLPAVGAAAHH